MNLWWVPGVAFGLIGLALVGLGVYDHDNQSLVNAGIGAIGLAGGYLVGRPLPAP